jgi:hypothetical protein
VSPWKHLTLNGELHAPILPQFKPYTRSAEYKSKEEIEAQARLADEVLKEVLAEEEAGGEDELV